MMCCRGMKDDWKAPSDRLEEMDRTFNKVAFPRDDEGLHAFNDTSVYWRGHCEDGMKQLTLQAQDQERPGQTTEDD